MTLVLEIAGGIVLAVVILGIISAALNPRPMIGNPYD